MFKKIVVATDFSKASTAALHAGISLATQCLARVEAIHVVTLLETVHHYPPFQIAPDWKSEVEERFEEFFPSSLYPNSGKQVLVGKSTTDEILKYARSAQCDLLVIGTHGWGTQGRTAPGSIAQRITRESEIPVMVVRGIEQSGERYQGYDRVLVPTDLSEAGTAAARLGAKFANFLKADLHLLHVIDLPALTHLQSIYPSVEMPELQASGFQVNDTLKSLVADQKLIGHCIAETKTGDPVDEILAYIEKEKIHFVIMGTHGRKRIERIILGSVTAGIVSRCAIPVITVSVHQD